MIKKLTLTAFILAILATPLMAADHNGNGLDDNLEISVEVATNRTDGNIAIVNTNGAAIAHYISRLDALGYTVTPIALDSDLETLMGYNLVILPVGHGDVPTYSTFDSRREDYLSYVENGGGLWVGQPNPWQHPDETADITWVPYDLTLYNPYNPDDCPVWLTDANHCITGGYYDNVFSFPGDTVVSMGPEWLPLVLGLDSGNPGAIVAEYGAGKVLAEFGHPSPNALCVMDDVALRQYVECTMGTNAVAIESISLGGMKAMFK